MLIISRSAYSQGANVSYFDKLPAANQAILNQLASLGLSKNWRRASARNSGRTMEGAFKRTADKKAWKALDLRFLQGQPGDEWKKYWTPVNSSIASTTIRVRAGSGKTARLLKLPEPPQPSGKFSDVYAGPLPGDAIVFRVGGTPIGGIWWGNRNFPGRKYKTSFFYYSHLPMVYENGRAKQTSTLINFDDDAAALLIGGTGYNSFPPRLTPGLLRLLFPKADKKRLTPNAKLFKGAGGYLASPFKNAYGAFYIAPERWADVNAPKLYVFRPKRRPEYVALKREMPYEKQVETRNLVWRGGAIKPGNPKSFAESDSCVFSAYAKIRAYARLGTPFENENLRVYEITLIQREVLRPTTPKRRNISRALAAYNDFHEANRHEKSLYHWVWLAYSTRLTAPLDDGVSGMVPVASGSLSPEELRRVIYQNISDDKPLLALLNCRANEYPKPGWAEGKKRSEDAVATLKGYRRIRFSATGPDPFGHAVVIVGARYDEPGSEWLVYFVGTNPYKPSESEGKFVVSLKEFCSSLRDPITRGALSRRNEWSNVPAIIREGRMDELIPVDFPSLFRLEG